MCVCVCEVYPPHPVTLPQPVAEPPVAEGCGSNHQDDVQDDEEVDEVACNNKVTPNIINWTGLV